MRPEAQLRAPRGSVTVFGEALIDEAPSGRRPGGAPFNVACHLARLGIRPTLVTRVGADPNGRRLVATAWAAGVATSGLQVDRRRPTARARVVVGRGGPSFRIPPRQAFDAIDARVARDAAPAKPRALYFGTLAQRAPASRRALAALLALRPAVRFLDVNLRAPWWDAETIGRSLAGATTVKANEEELATIALALGLGGRDTRARARALLGVFPCERLVVTRGANGAVLFSRGTRSIRMRRARAAPLPGPFVDSVGAGDAFAAVLLAGTLRGWTPAVTLARANRLAAALCTVPGAIPASDAFWAPFRNAWSAA